LFQTVTYVELSRQQLQSGFVVGLFCQAFCSFCHEASEFGDDEMICWSPLWLLAVRLEIERGVANYLIWEPHLSWKIGVKIGRSSFVVRGEG
jgi:hypothetical protein